jgi:isopenicillin-N epimerase
MPDLALLEAFGLDPDVLHLNHGAFGVAPVVVRRAAAAWRERAERNPHRFNTPDDYDRLADIVRELLDRHA